MNFQGNAIPVKSCFTSNTILLNLEMVGPIDKWDEIDYVYDMDLLATSLAAQLLR